MSEEPEPQDPEDSFHDKASRHAHVHDSSISKSSRELRIEGWLAQKGIVRGSPEEKVEEYFEKKRKNIDIQTMRHAGRSSRRSRESFNSDRNFSSLNESVDSSKLFARRNRDCKLASRFGREFAQLSLMPNRSASHHKRRPFELVDAIKIPPMSSQKYLAEPGEARDCFSPNKSNILTFSRQTPV